MLYCSQCGAPNEAGQSTCTRCGAALHGPEPDATLPVERPRATAAGHRPHRSRLPLWIALGVALAVLAALLVLPRLLGGSQDPTRAAMAEILAAAAPYQRDDGTVAPEDADAAIEAVYLSAQNSSLVISCHRDDYGVVIEVEEGPPYVYCPELLDPDPALNFDPLPLDPVSLDPNQPLEPNTAPNAPAEPAQPAQPGTPGSPDSPDNPGTPGDPAVQIPSIPRQEGSGALRILALRPYESPMRELAEQNGLPHDLEAPALVAWETVNRDPALWRFAAADNRIDGDVDMETLLHLDQYQVILWHGLGGYTESAGYFLCTSIPWSEELAERYGLTEDNCYRMLDGTVALRPAFFAEHYGEGAFYNAFIYLATSYSGKDPEMAQVFLDRGAAVVFVTTDGISRTYDLQMLHLVSESYLAGREGCKTKPALDKQLRDYGVPAAEPWTIRSSLDLAQITYGNQDPYLSRGARVIYYCRPGMESLPYEDWVALFDRSRGEALSPNAELSLAIDVEVTKYLSLLFAFNRTEFDPSTLDALELLSLGYTACDLLGMDSPAADYCIQIPLEDINAVLLRCFNRRVELQDGTTYYPIPNNSNWFFRYENGLVICPAVMYDPFPPIFVKLRSAFRQPDGTIHLVFTQYQEDSTVIEYLDELYHRSSYSTLFPEEVRDCQAQGKVDPVGTSHLIVAPRTETPRGVEDYYLLRYWYEQDPMPDLTGVWQNGSERLMLTKETDRSFATDVLSYQVDAEGVIVPYEMLHISFTPGEWGPYTLGKQYNDPQGNYCHLYVKYDGERIHVYQWFYRSDPSSGRVRLGSFERIFERAPGVTQPSAEPSSPAAEPLPDLTGRWLIVDAYRDIELDISNQRGNVFDLTVVNHQNGQGDLSFSVSDLTMVEGEASSRYTLPNTSSSGVLTLKWDQDRLILSVNLYDVTILNEIAKHATGIYVPETNVIEKYTVRVQEVLDGGASLRVTILEPYTLDRDYVLSLQVGDWVSALNFTTQVNRIEHNANATLYYLDNYTMIYLQDGDGILFYSMEQAVMVEREERILPVSPDFSARDYFYASNISNHPEEADTPVNLRTLIARYGPDLDGHQIRIAVVNGVIAEGYIGYYD